MKFELQNLVRDNIKRLTPYSSARHEFKGEASVFLDANENSYGSPLPQEFNRYPDPLQWKLKSGVARIKNIAPENIFIGNGSDEVIDLAYRIFCDPNKDNVIICPPTYGMYEVSANINDVKVRKVNLTENFQLDVERILNAVDQNTKLLFICSPNNPTGNSMNRSDIEQLLNNFSGLILIDEAYINFSSQRSFIKELTNYPNLIVMQTLSKAWGLASLRLGLAFASLEIIELFNRVKPPYNINKASQQLAIEALTDDLQVEKWIRQTLEQREYLIKELSKFPFVEKIFNSDANFLLVRVADANSLYQHLSSQKIIVRNRSKETMCENCLRITIGTPGENILLLNALKNYIA
jgi:histidinol-phosphate aminotransferase